MEFDKEELLLLQQILNNFPVQGTLQTLPEILVKLVQIQRKITAQLERSDRNSASLTQNYVRMEQH